jgi:hypothetical protein
MGLADYQKQKQQVEQAEATAIAVRTGNDVLRRILEEQKRTNELLAQLVEARA